LGWCLGQVSNDAQQAPKCYTSFDRKTRALRWRGRRCRVQDAGLEESRSLDWRVERRKTAGRSNVRKSLQSQFDGECPRRGAASPTKLHELYVELQFDLDILASLLCPHPPTRHCLLVQASRLLEHLFDVLRRSQRAFSKQVPNPTWRSDDVDPTAIGQRAVQPLPTGSFDGKGQRYRV
jgi:hypothetical protein